MARKEAKEVREANEKSTCVAAFFDLDGTLIPLPSLERRFFRVLRYRREIPLKNYFLWLREALRLLSRGIGAATQTNKMYLRGVRSFHESALADRSDFPGHASGHQAGGQASEPPNQTPRWPVPRFLEDALERAAWHAKQGRAIVLVSGTLEPLAKAAARELRLELAARGLVAKIRVSATKLQESDGKWTGRIVGHAMFGEAKARVVRALAEAMQLDLSLSHAYGDGATDEAMLASVGNPAAVNPSRKLTRIARKRGWPILRWNKEKELTQRSQKTQRAKRNEEIQRRESVLHPAERGA